MAARKAGPYRKSLAAFVKRRESTGDTKWDLFNRGGPNGEPPRTRAQMRRGRQGTPRKRPPGNVGGRWA